MLHTMKKERAQCAYDVVIKLRDRIESLEVPIGRRQGHRDGLFLWKPCADELDELCIIFARFKTVCGDVGKVLGLQE
jgi:hypothetical protein